jgi:hypothetical protein
MMTLILVLLFVMLVSGLPSWPYSRGWGYAPSGVVGLVLIFFIVWLLIGRGHL